MLKNFWFQWISLTLITLLLCIVVAYWTNQWIFGVLAYFVFGMIKDSILMTLHLKRTVDDNLEIK